MPKIWIQHYRCYNRGALCSNGGATLAFKDLGDGVAAVGVSVCSGKDAFCKKTGRDQATERLDTLDATNPAELIKLLSKGLLYFVCPNSNDPQDVMLKVINHVKVDYESLMIRGIVKDEDIYSFVSIQRAHYHSPSLADLAGGTRKNG